MIAPMDHSLVQPSASPGTSKIPATVERMTGMLWYEMLSAMNETGMDPSALGAGGGAFQSLFLWNIAEHDFGKYDSSLTAAAARQLGGTAQGAGAASTLPSSTTTAMPSPVIQAALQAAASSGASAEIAASLAPETTSTDTATAPAGSLLAQAKKFARAIWPQISQAAQALGVPPVAVLAQTALETGWGAAAPGHNLFGIKAADGETGTARATHEMVDGVLTPQTASFRDYPNLAASVADYIGLIQTGFAAATGQSSVAGFAQALQAGGYATDSSYAAKIVQIAHSPLMSAVLRAVSAPSQPEPKTGGS